MTDAKEVTIDGYKYTIEFEDGQEIFYDEEGGGYTWGQLQRYNYNGIIYNGDGEPI
jgi:hypothetical protein